MGDTEDYTKEVVFYLENEQNTLNCVSVCVQRVYMCMLVCVKLHVEVKGQCQLCFPLLSTFMYVCMHACI